MLKKYLLLLSMLKTLVLLNIDTFYSGFKDFRSFSGKFKGKAFT